MKQITTKLSNLHKLFNVEEYETEKELEDDIFIESLNKEYVKINSLVKKHTEMLKCNIEGIIDDYICAENHIIMTPEGWKFMKDADVVIDNKGNTLKVIEKTKIGMQDSYDVCLDSPHLYVTNNGLVHHNTFGALYKILEDVLEKSSPYKQVVIVRSAVQVRDQGFLPGSLEEKMEVYEAPYIDICKTLFNRTDAYSRLKEQGVIEFISTTAIRGRTFDNCIILVDECQSMTFHEISSVMTRVGHESKIFFCGDKYQNDLIKKRGDESGFDDFFGVLDTMEEFLAIYFTPDDIVRSGLVKSYIKACAAKNIIPSQ